LAGWLSRLNAVYSHCAVFLAVYIAEAHAKDEWPVGPTLSFCEQPRTIDERAALANTFIKKHNFTVPLLLDSMSNEFDKSYGVWPFRFYILHEGKIAYKPQPQADYTYDTEAIVRWLDSYATKSGIETKRSTVDAAVLRAQC